MKIFSNETVPLLLPEGHRFPARKYPLLRQRIYASGLFTQDELCQAGPATLAEVGRVHTSDYLQRVRAGALTDKEIRRIGLPWSPELSERSFLSVGATLAASQAALQEGVSATLGGGTHHAHADHGEGFCVFNDVAVAIRSLQAARLVGRALILDLDVHQGNGTAAIFAGDPTIFILDAYGAKNFPYHKQAVDIALPLPDGMQDAAYLDIIEAGLRQAFARAHAEVVFYLAGSDPFSGDTLGRLSVSKAGLQARDKLVLESCRLAGLPLVITMAGGYARPIEDTVDIHFETLRMAKNYARSK